jgi:predicted amino acid racemase
MLKGGAVSLGESRIENIIRLKEGGIKTDMMLLRTPMPSEIKDVINHADISLNSEIAVIKGLSDMAKEKGKIHKILLMLEMGELREGVNRENLDYLIDTILDYKGIHLYGLGMNLACLVGLIPTKEKIDEFENIVLSVEDRFGIQFEMVGGGNSANIPQLLKDVNHKRINNLRIGEGILLGLETVNRTPIPNTFQDSFILESEIIELKEKASVPEGKISQNAYGESPEFVDMGLIKRGLLAIGRQDVIVDGLYPIDENITILGSSSDHIAVHIDSSEYKVGEIVSFRMNYGALVSLFTSHYVKKVFLNR